MMRKDFQKFGFIGFGLILVVFAFQNCGQSDPLKENTATVDFSSTSANTTESPQSSNIQTAGNQGQSQTSQDFNSSVTPPSNGGSANTSSAVATTSSIPTAAGKVVRCGTLLSQLGWNSSSFVRADLSPLDNSNPTAKIEYAYSGFKISFFANASQPVFAEKFRMDDSGFVIKMRNKTTGQSLQMSLNSFRNNSSDSGSIFHGTAAISKFDNNSVASINLDVTRSFYESYKSQLGEVEIELSCDGAAGLKASQDFRALSPRLDTQMHKTSYGYLPDTKGFVGLSCAEEVPSGGQITCKLGGLLIDKIKWYSDNVEIPNYANATTVSLPSVSSGLHQVQAIATFKDGSSGPSLIRFIRVR